MNKLNPNQQKAVEIIGKPLIINAGPGTGKTKTLIEKVKYLVEQGKENILILTFTEKAATEIQNRLKAESIEFTGFAGTFHALAFKLLPNSQDFKIIPNTIRRNIIEECIKELKIDLNAKDGELLITKYKNSIQDTYNQKLVNTYNKKLVELGFIDFDDLLIRLEEILRQTQNDPTSQSYEGQAPGKYDYVLVDEFQDTNLLQYMILKSLVKDNNICVIGDPLQSIYGFRGSNSDIFEIFKKDFFDYEEIFLDINYRSGKEIIDVSHALFPKSQTLFPASEVTSSVKLIKTSNEYTEAEYVIREISKCIGGVDLIEGSDYAHEDQKANFADFAIVYRTHGQARILKQKFRECGIPYQVVGEGTIYDTKQFRFLFNVLSYIFLNDNEAFVEIITSKYLDINPFIINKLIAQSDNRLDKRIKIAVNHKELNSKTEIKLQEFINKLEELKVKIKEFSFSEIVVEVVSRFGLLERIKFKELLIDFQDLQNNLIRFNKYGQTAFRKYQNYISDLKINQGYDVKADKVSLLTIHASKGLEFEYVFISGFEQGNIPFDTSILEGNLDEEKRLLYVAMTRAKTYLYLITCKFRNREKHTISSFIEDISKSKYLIIHEDEIAKKLEIRKEKMKQKKSQFKMF